MDLLNSVGELLLLVAFFSVGLILFLMADRIARFDSWLTFGPFGWLTSLIWGEGNSNFTREGSRTFGRWYLRLFGLAWMAFFLVGAILASR